MIASVGLTTVLSRLWGTGGLQRAFNGIETARRGPRPVARWRAGVGMLRIGDAQATQPDSISCGATVAVVVNSGYDAALWQWLDVGVDPRLSGVLPPELVGLDLDALSDSDGAGRLRAAVQNTHLKITSGGWAVTGGTSDPDGSTEGASPVDAAIHSLRFRWPASLGTPPWALAGALRVPGVEYAHRPVDDRSGSVMDDVVDLTVEATAKGYAVPLYTGGNLRQGLTKAAPRHVIVALPRMSRTVTLRLYEPASGRIHLLAPQELRRRNRGHAALGGWSNVTWIVHPTFSP